MQNFRSLNFLQVAVLFLSTSTLAQNSLPEKSHLTISPQSTYAVDALGNLLATDRNWFDTLALNE